MGNLFGRSKLKVTPLEDDIGMTTKSREDGGESSRKSLDATTSLVRIKVRMTKAKLDELMAHASMSQGDSTLGHLIVKECLEGRLCPRVVVGQPHALVNSRSRLLSTSIMDEERI
ncbi:hypothetical protein Goshw_011405 [Gossypium schwendimanii]|uniref:Uncharacterized protein n=1 Tax=Gossypium schwendimanii TaxID=34291 RepID=A0A7J9LWT1_GOSSC|nr:hypothetical protein [Gossypium schwendimanii]